MAFSCAIGATVWLKISWPERKTGCDVWEVPWVPIAPYNPANERTTNFSNKTWMINVYISCRFPVYIT